VSPNSNTPQDPYIDVYRRTRSMRCFNHSPCARRSGLARRAIGITLGASALAAVLAAPAQAGTMTTYTCRTPDGQRASTAGWTNVLDNPSWDVSNHCAAGGTLKIEAKGGGHSSDEAQEGMRFTPAPNTTLHGAELYRAASLPYSSNTWGWSYSIGAGSTVFESNSAAQSPGGNGSSGAGSMLSGWNYAGNRLLITDQNALSAQNELVTGMRCAGTNGQTCADPGNDAFLHLYGAWFKIHDATDPAVSNVGGSLIAPGAKDGIETLTYNASDTGAGLYRAILEVDGQPAQTTVVDGNGGSCADAVSTNTDPYEFSHRQPCKLTINSGEFSIDTRLIAEGERAIRVRIEDATGNRANVYGPMPITIDNIPPPTSTSPPVVSGTMVRGSQLSTDAGGWTGNGVPFTLAYQWQRSADSGASWADIPGATGTSYTLGAGDVGRQIRTKVTGSSSEGTTTAHSASAGQVTEPAAPAMPPADGTGVGAPGADGQSGSGGADGTDGTNGGGAQTIVQTANGRDASPTATLAAAFDGTRSKRIKVRYGKQRRIMGTLLLPNGQPIVGARLDVTSQAKLMGALPVAAGQVVTDGNGRFAYPFNARLSRTITIGYRWYTQASSYTHTTAVNVDVIPAVSMKPSRATLRNGQSVKFTGKIKGAPKRARKVVEIQALDGRRWRTIATVRVNKRKAGRFTYRYRFTRTRRPTVYQFRASVRGEQGWPFVTGHSKPRKVKVLP